MAKKLISSYFRGSDWAKTPVNPFQEQGANNDHLLALDNAKR